MAEEYVRTEVFEARMDRMEALMEKTVMEIKAENERFRREMQTEMSQLRTETQTGLAENKALILETRGEVRALAAHINTLEYWGAIVFAAATVIFGIAQYFQNKRAERESISDEIKEQVRELRQIVMARRAEASERDGGEPKGE